jgi:hypothetical protein
MQSHASNPLAFGSGPRVRAYFATRDAEMRSHIGMLELDLDDPTHSEAAVRCVLSPGPLGGFSDHGVYPSSIVEHDGRCYLYYAGINPGRDGPLFYTSIGLALSEDGGESFTPAGQGPLLGRSEVDPCLVTSPCVLLDDGTWRMWYVSGFRWDRAEDGTPRSWYHIKYAESDDGIAWRREGHVCIDHEHDGERNISRPCVLKSGGTYRMWYAYGGDFHYRIGYAESPDGYRWSRLDDRPRLELQAADWESESQTQPWVIMRGDRHYLLYCGNDLGRDGFGLAVLGGSG